MFRDVTGAVIGVMVAMLTVMLFNWVSHLAFPPPEFVDPTDTESMIAYMKEASIAALMIVLAGYLIAAFDGTLIAALIGRARTMYFAMIVGVLLLVGTVTNLIMIPHPAWFVVSSVAGIVVFAAAAAFVGDRIRAPREPST